MASRPVRKHHRSLSPISNRVPVRESRQSKSDAAKRDDDPESENFAWDVINGEISEWQTICQTGRPSRWSPGSNWIRGGVRSTWQEELRSIPPWRMNLDHDRRLRQRYDTQRRAVTDSYLADNKNVHDLAYLVAVQLLGACFTLPPEQVSGYKSPTYNYFDIHNSSGMPGSRLISSLQMHIEARYSPSFGYQARNTSPANCRQGARNGKSASGSRESSRGCQSPNTQLFRETSRRQRIHRVLHATEDSISDCSIGSHSSLFGVADFLPAATVTTWNRVRRDTGNDRNTEPLTTGDGSTKDCLFLGEFGDLGLHTCHLASKAFNEHTVGTGRDLTDPRTPNKQRHRCLKSVIRSDPHHKYIQPVKELVVKRWQRVRRRLGYSLGNGHPSPVSREPRVKSSVSTSSRSTPAEGSNGSPVLSSDGKERRRQARERGDIHSNGVGNSSHHNMHISATESGPDSPARLNHPFLDFEYPYALGVAEAIANAFADSGLTAVASLSFTPPNSRNPSGSTSPSPVAFTRSLNSKTDLEHLVSSMTGSSNPLKSTPTFSTRHRSQRQQRKSMLSEVCTPEDTEGAFSAVDSNQTRSREEVGDGPPSQTRSLSIDEEELDVTKTMQNATEFLSGQDEIHDFMMRRPSIVRTNTSGTQIFRPSEDGIEIDGLPTGPPAQSWDDPEQRGKNRERSFL